MLNINQIAFDNLTTLQRDALTVSKGSVIYNVDTEQLQVNTGTALAPVWSPLTVQAEIVPGGTPPADNSKYWKNTADNELYFWDGVNWVGIEEKSVLFTEPGSTAANVFLKIGDVRSSPIRGWFESFQTKTTRVVWTNTTGSAQSYTLLKNGASVQVINTTASARGETSVVETFNANDYASFQYTGGPGNNNVILQMLYRKIGA